VALIKSMLFHLANSDPLYAGSCKCARADETVIQVLKEEGKRPSPESRMWVYCSGNTGTAPVVLFEYQPTRSGEHARRLLEGFHGFLQTDGYIGYDKVSNVMI
jgi:hypothetical protein